jgi:hypothetical protein
MEGGVSLMKGEKTMRILRGNTWFGLWGAILFGASMFIGGCAATINYSYDPVADFSTVKNYSWLQESLASRQDPLVEKNVRYYADKFLKDKGFTLTSDKPEFVISMNYALDYYDTYTLRFLNFYVYRAPSRELIWQGTADGAIKADATSSDLADAVKNILANFPPKR